MGSDDITTVAFLLVIAAAVMVLAVVLTKPEQVDAQTGLPLSWKYEPWKFEQWKRDVWYDCDGYRMFAAMRRGYPKLTAEEYDEKFGIYVTEDGSCICTTGEIQGLSPKATKPTRRA